MEIALLLQRPVALEGRAGRAPPGLRFARAWGGSAPAAGWCVFPGEEAHLMVVADEDERVERDGSTSTCSVTPSRGESAGARRCG
jgi:hypothetical protein